MVKPSSFYSGIDVEVSVAKAAPRCNHDEIRTSEIRERDEPRPPSEFGRRKEGIGRRQGGGTEKSAAVAQKERRGLPEAGAGGRGRAKVRSRVVQRAEEGGKGPLGFVGVGGCFRFCFSRRDCFVFHVAKCGQNQG